MSATAASIGQATRVDDIGGRFDPWLLGVSIALACCGVVMVGSAAVAGAGMDVGPWYFLNRHALFLAGGVVLAGIAMLFLPGQGLLTILISICMMDVPGKRRLLDRLAANEHIQAALNWVRRKRGKPEFEFSR